MQQVAQYLATLLQEAKLVLSKEVQQNLVKYLKLLHKWSQVHNLTAIKDPLAMVSYHILDSLSILPFLATKGPVLDVGTGAGLPGIPLAIVCTDMNFILLDSKLKKINFVQHVVTSLQLTNVQVVNARIENYLANFKMATIVSRAFASIATFAKLSNNLADSATLFIAMKGKRDKAMLEDLPAGFKVIEFASVKVPGLEAPRTLVVFRKASNQIES